MNVNHLIVLLLLHTKGYNGHRGFGLPITDEVVEDLVRRKLVQPYRGGHSITPEGGQIAMQIMEDFKRMADQGLEVEEEDPMPNIPTPGSKEAKAKGYADLAKDLYDALNDILEIGKRNMANSKYDGYFDTANQVCNRARKELGLSDEV